MMNFSPTDRALIATLMLLLVVTLLTTSNGANAPGSATARQTVSLQFDLP